jgi:23S rRNA-/tRNA-specific pseudouridylate synthase
VVCDALYAPKQKCILGFSRTALHAFSLEIMSPSGKPLRFEAPLPEDFSQALKELKTS